MKGIYQNGNKISLSESQRDDIFSKHYIKGV